jgi:hypothetical protein
MVGIGEMSAEERHRLIIEIVRKFVGEALAPILRRLDALEARMQEQPASEGNGLIYGSVAEGAHDKSAWMHPEASER